ncbi:MAG: hypothetical protein C4B59_07030 [Candidatus Methanogaster sp.]|uniref:Uncharacterized protein n=1 Tax=Candidatus Methanogaster sp. TaxID=3386292 RepID=A0AC61L383_9EURY|nr:MAG: hypothetical protein C4B59_07030 [ANME-2 cluster archaeon]
MESINKLLLQIVLLIITVLPFIVYTELGKIEGTSEPIRNAVEVINNSIYNAIYFTADILDPFIPPELGTAHDIVVSVILIAGMLLTVILAVLIVRTSANIITEWAMEKDA